MLPAHEFQRCVRRYGGDQRHRGFSCMVQFLAQLTGRESLRDIEACLRSVDHRLYHLGFRGRTPCSNLRGSIPTFLPISSGREHDVSILDEIVPEAG